MGVWVTTEICWFLLQNDLMQYGLLVFELKNRRVKIQSIKKQKKLESTRKFDFKFSILKNQI
jgi:hypothetical protein